MQSTFNFWKDNVGTKRFQTITSIVLIVLVFSLGLYVGDKNDEEDLSNSAGANLAPFWDVWEILNERFSPASSTVPTITSEQKVWGAMAGLAASYGDPYTVFFPPVESQMFGEEISGSFDGVGMEIDNPGGVLTVVTPLKGSPAERAGVKPGDIIVEIDGKPSDKFGVGDAVKLISGGSGTSVTITFIRSGVREPLIKKITREPINIPTVETKKLEGGIFVIELYNFSAVSPGAFRAALREFVESKSDQLILDLRNNPGGYLEAALDMASWFLPAGELVVREDFGGKKEDYLYKSKGYDVFEDDLKFIILVNKGSASAAEILAGALREHGKAILIGEDTFGKGSVQELIDLPAGTSLKITVAHWFTPEGVSISNGGLKPDIEVLLTPENTKDGADPVLNRAVEFLKTGR